MKDNICSRSCFLSLRDMIGIFVCATALYALMAGTVVAFANPKTDVERAFRHVSLCGSADRE
jgi:hypothetical protein